MGGAVSSGRDNNELIDNLMGGGYIRTRAVERVFRVLDRADYMSPEARDQAYKDLAWRNGPVHLSAPCIYSEVMEALELKPGLSFLNLGSGTGYLSTLAGLIIGSGGISHGVDCYPVVIEYANKKLGQFIENSVTLDEFDFCMPKYYCGNALALASLPSPYDRVYCGAGVLTKYENYFKRLVKIGGVLVMPLGDTLVQMRRVSEEEWVTRKLLNVSFALLRLPAEDELSEPLKMDELIPPPLMVLARSVIRASMRRGLLRRHPSLREPPPRTPPAPRPYPRRVCIPLDADSDAEGLNELHDLDPASGANEMNALLSLVLSMGQNRVAGSLRLDSIDDFDTPITSDSEEDEDTDEDDDEDGDDGEDPPGDNVRRNVLRRGNRDSADTSDDGRPRREPRPRLRPARIRHPIAIVRSAGLQPAEPGSDEADERSSRSDVDDRATRSDVDDRAARSDVDERPGRSDVDLRAGRSDADERASRSDADERKDHSDVDDRPGRSDVDDRSGRSDVDDRSSRPDADDRMNRSDVDDRQNRSETKVSTASDNDDGTIEESPVDAFINHRRSASERAGHDDTGDRSARDEVYVRPVRIDIDDRVRRPAAARRRGQSYTVMWPGPYEDEAGSSSRADVDDRPRRTPTSRSRVHPIPLFFASHRSDIVLSRSDEDLRSRTDVDDRPARGDVDDDSARGDGPKADVDDRPRRGDVDERPARPEGGENDKSPDEASTSAGCSKTSGYSPSVEVYFAERAPSDDEEMASSMECEEVSSSEDEGARGNKRQKLDSGIGEGVSSGATADESPASSGPAEEAAPLQFGERGPVPQTRDARRVRLSIVMKRGVKELPLPYALKKYVNLGRCFEF